MTIKSPTNRGIFSALDQTYGLIDGSTGWPGCLEALIDLAGLKGSRLFLYECTRGQSQLIEAMGDAGRKAGDGNGHVLHDMSIDDFLWRGATGTIWSPAGNNRIADSSSGDARAMLSGKLDVAGYAVIDRDHAHILYLEFLGKTSDGGLDREACALLEDFLPHLHRACHLQRSIRGDTLLNLLRPGNASSFETSNLSVELRLRRRFRLSKAEARVAKLLADGLAPRVIADRLHVSIHTIRSQLQSIFQKTDTCRQAELTSLLLRETDIPTALCQARPVPSDRRERPSCL